MKLSQIDISGKKVGRLTVLKKVREEHPSRWLCECSCGNKKDITYYVLVKDKIKSCGCLQRENAAKSASMKSRTHGMKRTPTYNSWQSMKSRCYRSKDICFSRYGGRGIKVCSRWENSFENFYDDMGERPEGCTLDRINFDKDYSPENCRWATVQEQQNNRSSNSLFTYKGRTQNIRAWADEFGIGYYTLQGRLFNGWPIERALLNPVRKKNAKLIKWNGKKQTLHQWCLELGLNKSTVKWRLGSGWNTHDAFTTPVGQKPSKKQEAA